MKNILKKSISILMSACMLMSVVSVGVISTTAAEVESAEVGRTIIKWGDYKYKILSDTTAAFCGPAYVTNAGYHPNVPMYFNTDIKKYTIPSEIEGYKITEIYSNTFYNCLALEEVTIPDTITKIGAGAFQGCESLEKIKLPDSVTVIGSSAFGGCSDLKEINIPEDIKSIGSHVFSGCSSLTSFVWPENIKTIPESAFENCYKLKEVELPESLEAIQYYAFGDCVSLKEIIIPDSVRVINGAFYSCTSLKSITLPDSVTNIDDAFDWCTSLESITIPDSVTSIKGTFSFCKALESIAVPDSVTTLGYGAFWGCYNLTEVNLPKSLTTIDNRAFALCHSLEHITIPESVTTIKYEAFVGCKKLKSITIPASVTEIGDYAFGYDELGSNGGGKKADFCIYGYKDTAAETYANENGFEFYDLSYIGIDDIVFLDENVKPEINKITDGEVFDSVNSQLDNEVLTAIYDMKFESEKNITIKIPSVSPLTKLYSVDADGVVSRINTVYENGYLKMSDIDGGRFAVATIKNDIDCNGQTDVNDVTALQMYLAGYDSEVDITCVDVNKDGKTDVSDVTKLQLVLAGA